MVGIDVAKRKVYEIVNDKDKLHKLYKEYKNDVWVGYNSRHYDQFILKGILAGFNPNDINDWIIVKKRSGWEYSNLFHKIPLNNFDCMTSFHGLKTLEAFQGKSVIETDVDFNIDRKLTADEINSTIRYCTADVENTIDIFFKRKSEFDSVIGLINMFDLPLSDVNKTKAQLSAKILGAKKCKRNDEFDIKILDCVDINKYTEVVDFFKNDWNYEKKLEIDVAGVPHVFASGGIHGAIPKYIGYGEFLHIDVASYYPSLMILFPEYCYSRNTVGINRYKEIKEQRLKYKKAKNPLQAVLKIILNSTYGVMKDKTNAMYDPRQANNICVNGQLLLLSLIERLEGHCDIVNTNTDGIIVKLHNNYDEIVSIVHKFEERTGLEFEFEKGSRIIQGDVNNYIVVNDDGSIERVGGYVKELSELDYDLPIVNRAIVNALVHNIPVEKTVCECDNLIDFQKVVKVSTKYAFGVHNGKKQKDKVFRVFASKSATDGIIGKCKSEGATVEKFANTPDRCFVMNDDIRGMKVPVKLDRQWYIDIAKKRLYEKFGVNL